ncbi:hypothetical protein SDC9_210252 [bioreactor metagenome]|uniref:Uncharacterized protein n=1 Tax=bioreactor metagenome TaxID=1076179 RepID=A0A645JT49_9ZZZZ
MPGAKGCHPAHQEVLHVLPRQHNVVRLNFTAVFVVQDDGDGTVALQDFQCQIQICAFSLHRHVFGCQRPDLQSALFFFRQLLR